MQNSNRLETIDQQNLWPELWQLPKDLTHQTDDLCQGLNL